MGRRGYSAGFRRRVVDLVAAGRKVAEVARDPGVSDQTSYSWRRQDASDRGRAPGLSSPERGELAAAKRRLTELETELAIHRRAALAGSHPHFTRAGIRVRGYGQDVLARLTGKRIHASWAVPGGVRWPLGAEAREEFTERR